MYRQPIYILGYGRSGTNWLLNTLNLHPDTHCRNEPYSPHNSPFNDLPHSDGEFQPDENFEILWDKAIDWARMHYGERDRMPLLEKNFLYSFPLKYGLWRILEKRKLRLLLSPISPTLALQEWRLPWWLGSKDALQHARPVLKIVGRHNWGKWLLKHQLNAPKIHIIRHPGGVVQSWSKRYLAHNDFDMVMSANIDRLKCIIKHKPEWGSIIGDLSHISVQEAEMWFWRYSTEELLRAGQRTENYMVTVYEKIVENPVTEIRKIYDFCNLELSNEIIKLITPHDSNEKTKAPPWYAKIAADPAVVNNWQNSISKESRTIIEKVLTGSRMEKYWN